MSNKPTSPLPFRDSTQDEIIAYQEARERFFEVVYEWANGLIEDGIRTKRCGTDTLAQLEALSVPKVAYTRSEYPGNMEITINVLPEQQRKVWRAARQLVVDAYKATRKPEPESESSASPSPSPPRYVDRLTFSRDHGGCPLNIDYQNHRIECIQHGVCLVTA